MRENLVIKTLQQTYDYCYSKAKKAKEDGDLENLSYYMGGMYTSLAISKVLSLNVIESEL